MDLVSVIIPTFNRFKYLLHAIKSVNEQTYKNIEIIVINDCSTQENYYKYDFKKISGLKIFIVHLPKNSKDIFGFASPGGHARNIGMMIASGKYISFLDDDDYFLPTKIEKQIYAMKKYNSLISCTEAYAGYGSYNLNSKYKLYHCNIHWNTLQSIFGKNIDILNKMFQNEINIWSKKEINIHNCTCGGSSIIIDKCLIQKAGYFPIMPRADDYMYWKTLINYSNCVALKEPLVYLDRNHGDGQNY
tara:strand:- start:4928 stop:5665 length:738 start_codon:yes stop_codon:yes gene_type:complete